jgi:hypothetical protein
MKRAMDELKLIRAARQARSDFVRAALLRLWEKLSGRVAAPVAAKAA